MNYIFGRDRLQASVECFEDYVETDNEVRVIDKIIDTLDIESLGFKIGNNDISGRPMYNPKDMLKLSEDIGSDIDEIEFVGVVSNMCVISNVVTFQSQYVNSQLIVDADLTASFDESLHEKAMDVIESLQVKVVR